ncbi:putative thioredoxin-like protein [Corynebacterium kutscheri]|uniref:Thioredoxin domain-containing protein n=1 Tax=Corynebacterium kutscheri TaxID=35755 RepID=A0A0F6TDW4_9CORY|nr:tetratricopeptide repeat protein [Corynebacterium kutscheri]AKE41621.1 thioredoxin domain-containing protein [Corynebacterium kutscheri]VEH08896.1 putative thioredoxin-like protein [Corynebacterium kutscheri]VEH09947.1 putative thioredoxin-like protein [Corynebacterium kutscheri]VEH80025.1 putative thioredoxin-like protein [Corynebacterium kutscheri]
MTTPNRFVAGAIDLGEVKARADARANAAHTTMAGGVAGVLTLSMDNVEEELIKRSTQVPVIVLIGTSRSPESEQLRADFSQLVTATQNATPSFVFRYVDADQTPQVAQMFGIQGLPTVVAIASGQPIANFEGGQPKEALEKWSAAVVEAVAGQLTGLPEDEDTEPAEDPRFAPATQALNNGDFDAAIAVYDAILVQEPKNAMALKARDNARLLARLQQADHSTDPVVAADANPDDIELACAAADHHIAAGLPELAFERLITFLPNDAARTRLLELFALFEPTDPRVISARAAMANKLF